MAENWLNCGISPNKIANLPLYLVWDRVVQNVTNFWRAMKCSVDRGVSRNWAKGT